MSTPTSPGIVDALIVVPPLSPSDTNPPLGPYLLRTCFQKAGLALDVCDLSIAYLRAFGASSEQRTAPILGDQDKDRDLIGRAKRHFLEATPLRTDRAMAVPCCGNALTGMHFGFSEIQEAARAAIQPGQFWSGFLERSLFARHGQPAVLGLSVMGPPQMFVALTIAAMAKERWPATLIVAGGSHVTLLKDEISRDARYGGLIDALMPGHCENDFVALCRALRAGEDWRRIVGVIVPGNPGSAGCGSGRTELVPLTMSAEASPVPSTGRAIELVPTFTVGDLEPFDPTRVTLPLQLARGCLFQRCTMCTYPAAEPGFSGYPDWNRVGDALELLIARHGVNRFSFKDSFMVPKMLRDLADLISDRQLSIRWSATTMLHERLTPHLLRQLAETGCRTLEFGLETIWPQGQRLFDKIQPLHIVEHVMTDTVAAGIVANINLIYGLPGESIDQARGQVRWFLEQQDRWRGLVTGSHNMLEINRSSPMAADPSKYGISLNGIAPWAFSYAWDAPAWRAGFREELQSVLAVSQEDRTGDEVPRVVMRLMDDYAQELGSPGLVK